jgi:uncharacterized protein (TIGR03067 family)
MMNLNMFRCVLGVSTVLWAIQAIADDKPQPEFQGTWKVTKCTVNGQQIDDRQIVKSEFTLSDDELVVKPGDGSTREVFKIKPEANSTPAAIQVTRTEPANKPQQGWQIYEVKDGRLRIAFYDALRERPKSFDPQPKMIVLELEKLPDAEN